jgi:hypothetical protein
LAKSRLRRFSQITSVPSFGAPAKSVVFAGGATREPALFADYLSAFV